MFYFPVRVGREVLGAIVGRDRKIHEMYTVSWSLLCFSNSEAFHCRWLNIKRFDATLSTLITLLSDQLK